MNNAWMLRNDGQAFAVKVHLYTMDDDEDFSSQAEVSAFLLNCGLSDEDSAKYCLDAWMAELVAEDATEDSTPADLDELLKEKLDNLPYKFPYPLDIGVLIGIHYELNNWYDYNTLESFCETTDASRQEINKSITQSVNQQFCRSRFGGQFDTHAGSHDMWFRISSFGFNWADVIYTWVAEHATALDIDTVTVCRDPESDYGFDTKGKPEHFYKAKDGSVYHLMPVDQFLSSEHESNPVFAQTDIGMGPRYVMGTMLGAGYTISAAERQSGISFDKIKSYYLISERRQCIQSSEFMDEAHPKTQVRMRQLQKHIETQYPNVSVQDIDMTPYEYAGGRVIDSLDVQYTEGISAKTHTLKILLNKGLARTTVDEMMRQFRMGYRPGKS